MTPSSALAAPASTFTAADHRFLANSPLPPPTNQPQGLASAPPAGDAGGPNPYAPGGGLDLYFALARGAPGAPALDMSKHLDTNYHHEVPELSDDTGEC